jgi:urease accessory protein
MRDLATHMPAHPPNGFPGELLAWLSPAFPIGGFAYSQGLESAVTQGWVGDAAALEDWLARVLAHGALRNDLIVIAQVLGARDSACIRQLADLSAALQPTAERAHEALDQGRSFRAAYDAGWAEPNSSAIAWPERATFPVALAVAARARGIDPAATLEAYAIAYCSNLLSAAIRLGVTGQYGGQRVLAALLPAIRRECVQALSASLDDLGAATFGADLASMLHETQQTRLFRS